MCELCHDRNRKLFTINTIKNEKKSRVCNYRIRSETALHNLPSVVMISPGSIEIQSINLSGEIKEERKKPGCGLM